MYNIMIFTHGNMALALKETLKMFTQEAEEVCAVGLHENGVEAFRQNVAAAAKQCYKSDQELLVFVDIFGGTPFNVSILEIKNKYPGTEVIAGVNLPMLIEASLGRRHNCLRDMLPRLQEAGKQSVIVAEQSCLSEDDE